LQLGLRPRLSLATMLPEIAWQQASPYLSANSELLLASTTVPTGIWPNALALALGKNMHLSKQKRARTMLHEARPLVSESVLSDSSASVARSV
jgi:hypothetical protein